MKEPPPVLVAHLFPELLAAFTDLLGGLSAEEWARPTACAGWSVKDVALHLLGIEVGNLSLRRDGHNTGAFIAGWEELVAFLNDFNQSWVAAARRLSPRLLVDLLGHTGRQMSDYFQTLDPSALGGPVSWAGPDPAPVWLDLAREYTERWHHQQHIRDAVGRPGLKEPRYLAPALAAFVRAMPRAFEARAAAEGACVTLTIDGPAGGQWTVRREAGAWRLYAGPAAQAQAEVGVAEDLAWRLFTRGLTDEQARAAVTLRGDRALGEAIFEMVSIIA